MQRTMIKGAQSVLEFIEREFQQREVLVTLSHEEHVVADFMTIIDDVQPEYKTYDLTDEEAEAFTEEDWDKRIRCITVTGETIEVTPMEGSIYATQVTFVVDDPAALQAEWDGNTLYVDAGGEWHMELKRLREPVRHKAHEFVEWREPEWDDYDGEP